MSSKKPQTTKTTGTHTVNKSAETGRFVSDKQVQSKPNTTYKQTVFNSSNKKGK